MASTSASSTALSPGLTALADLTPRRASELDQNPLLRPPDSRAPDPRHSDPRHSDPRSSDPLLSAIEEEYPSIHGLSGRSPVMRRLIQQMRRMAPHLALATIEGDHGTGLTLAARALHAAGPAPAGPFVPCLATQFFTPENPTAAASDKPQRWSTSILDAAHAGMLFLDRVHQLSVAQQESLADFLHWFDDRHCRARHRPSSASEANIQRGVGEALPAQIVFATSVSLRNPTSHGRFRDDLASRLCSVRFYMPPLAQRREDIPLLAQIFIQRFARIYGKPVRGLGPGAMTPLLRYSWPGNVRELEETITAAALETESQWIRPIDLPSLAANTRQADPHPSSEAAAEPDFTLDQAIRSHVSRVLSRTRGNKLRAAQLLGISRSTLYRILAANPGNAGSTTREAGF